MAFWDTSAIVPLFCEQTATARVRPLQEEHPEMAVWWGTPVEIRSALARLAREGAFTLQALEEARTWLGDLRRAWKEVLPSDAVRDLAERLVEKHRLRALDAFQLAAAVTWCQERPRNRPFICVDARLAQAAEQAGFRVLP